MTALSCRPDLPGHAAWAAIPFTQRAIRVYLDDIELKDVVAVDLSGAKHQVTQLPRRPDGRIDAQRLEAGDLNYQWGKVRVVLGDGSEWRG